MTLSLDDVRNKRFRMARKSGYEVLEVDEFVDEVEETFAQLVEENGNLKKQVDALRGEPGRGGQQAAPSGSTVPVAPRPAAAPTPAPRTPIETIQVTTSHEASTAVVRLVELATQQSEQLVFEANQEAERIRQEAGRAADEVTAEARTRAEQAESEARGNAQRLQAETTTRSQQLEAEIAARRTEMFGQLEHQHDALTSTVASLREFEASYRANLAGHLRGQLESLDKVGLEPAGGPERRPVAAPSGGTASGDQESDVETTLGGGSSSSDTPRLDALLGDQR